MIDLFHKTINKNRELDTNNKTVPILFKERVEEKGKELAFRHKDMGIYREVSWQEYWNQVEELCMGLLGLGLNRGDRVAIACSPRKEWFYADLAILCAGGVSCGIYCAYSPEETCYSLERIGAKFFIAENQEYLDKVLPSLNQFPYLLKIIVIDVKAPFIYQNHKLISFSDVQKLGRRRKTEEPNKFIQSIQQTHIEQPAFFVFTSGTTGLPKATIITHRNVVQSFFYSFGEIFQKFWTHEQRSVCCLDLANPLEKCISIYFPLIFDLKPHIGKGIEYLQETLFEVQPTFFHAIPRIWKKMAGQIVVGIENSSWFKKWCFHRSMKIGWYYMNIKWRSEKIPLIYKLLRLLAKQICFRHVLHQAGLLNTKYVLSFGAPLPPQIQRLWQVWGVDLINLFGTTEVVGIISSQRPGFPEPGNLGGPTTINEIRLGEDGELIVSGPGVFGGYWNDEEKTNEVIKDGWFYTGEVFERTNEGNLKYLGHKKDIVINSRGDKISPIVIENAIKSSPFIREVVVLVDDQKFPCALIEIEFNSVAEWAQMNKLLYTGFTSLMTHPDVKKLIEEEVIKGNQSLSEPEKVKKFKIIPRELRLEKGEITPLGMIKKDLIFNEFVDLAKEMFLSKEGETLQ